MVVTFLLSSRTAFPVCALQCAPFPLPSSLSVFWDSISLEPWSQTGGNPLPSAPGVLELKSSSFPPYIRTPIPLDKENTLTAPPFAVSYFLISPTFSVTSGVMAFTYQFLERYSSVYNNCLYFFFSFWCWSLSIVPVPGESDTLFWPPQALNSRGLIVIQTGKTFIHVK